MPLLLTKRAHRFAAVSTGILLTAVIALTWFEISSTRTARSWVRHTEEIIRGIDELRIALRDAEVNQRSYLLTGQDASLVNFRGASERIALRENDLRRLTADNPLQQARLREIRSTTRRKLDELFQTAQVRRDAGLTGAISLVQSNIERGLLANIEEKLVEFATEEERLLQERQSDADRAQVVAFGLAIGGFLVAIGMVSVAGWFLELARKRVESAAAEQLTMAEQMSTAFESVSQGIAVFSPGKELTRWNECFTILLDLPPPMMRPGTPYEAIVAQAVSVSGSTTPFLETEEQLRPARGTRAAGRPIIYERTRATDGRTFEIRRTGTPDSGFVLTVSDITERVRAEATARDSQRLQAMGQLTGGIAHDFNNLLTVVLGNLEFAQSRLGSDHPIIPRIERAIWGAKRGAALTHQLLAFARKQPLAPTAFDVSAMLPDMTNLLRRTLGEHIDVRVVDMAGLWHAVADPAQVESAVLNLALNARDAMPDGGRLTIEVANKVLDEEYARQHIEVTPGDYVMLAVSDTGTGMAPDVLARVFEPFFTTKEPGRGTGLGLAMVYGFAKQSGGHVKIYSELGEGTTVRLYLPRAIGSLLPAAQRPAIPMELPRGSATVLIVEDEPAVREVAATILRDLDYRVLEAGAGPEALRVFGESGAKIDLLLVDVVLAGPMKGNEVAARITEIRPSVRVLFMSGYTENAIVHHGRLDDGVHLIGKPFHRDQLARKVAEVLNLPPASRAPADGNVIDLGMRERGRAP